MRRFVGFALVGMLALWLVSFLPPSASTITIAIVVGIGAAGGTVARDGGDVVAIAVGAFTGTAAGGVTRGLGSGGPDASEVITASATIGLVVAAAGFIALVVSRARRPQPPARSGR